jgi:alpha-ketoglutarate-dependent taurine dioxygenase
MDMVRDTLEKEGQVIHVIRPASPAQASFAQLTAYVQAQAETLNALLLETGAILFRGFALDGQAGFAAIKDVLAGTAGFNYVDGNSPRTKLASDIYTSTEYPPEYPISLHSELSYSRQWPARILFFCQTPALAGGETPVTDCRLILRKLAPALVAKFEQHGVKYTRYLRGGRGAGKSWMDTFETTDRQRVEQFCAENEVAFFWEGNNLALSQWGHGVAEHPLTKEKVWFNQANQFHPSSLPEEVYQTLRMLNAKQVHKYPQYAFYGNGEEISEQDLRDITDAHFEAAIRFPWQQGDLLLLDNMLMAHGRMPFEGPRKILVSMY